MLKTNLNKTTEQNLSKPEKLGYQRLQPQNCGNKTIKVTEKRRKLKENYK
jgi:hypothetical protein